MGPSDPQLGPIGALIILIAILAMIGYSGWGLYHWYRDWRDWRRHRPAGRMTCDCPCRCGRPGQADDDGTPGHCDPCRMNIHAEDAATTLARIDTMEEQGQL